MARGLYLKIRPHAGRHREEGLKKMRTEKSRLQRATLLISSCLLVLLALSGVAHAQGRRGADNISDSLLDIKVSEITLESIDFRNQRARMSVGLDVSNRLVPVKLKDFDYRLSLFEQEMIEGSYQGTMRVGGRTPSRISLPVEVNLRSIPGVVWNAFSNRGQVRYQLDAGFTLPLFIFNKRVDQSFSGEVPLRSLVDAASLMRARRLGSGLGGVLRGDW